jgi:hypothetical protein
MNEIPVCSNFTPSPFKPRLCNQCFHLISEHPNVPTSDIQQANATQANNTAGTPKNIVSKERKADPGSLGPVDPDGSCESCRS